MRLAEVGLQMPPEVSLKTWAEHQNWARRGTGVPSAGRSRERDHFTVHLRAWDQSFSSERAQKRREQFETMNVAAEALGYENDVWEVPPQTVLPAGDVVSVLQTGRFQVTGTVYFRPLQPFDPEPTIPSEESDEILARADVGGKEGFTYPDDAQ